MRTRLIVSAVTATALALGSLPSFAHGRDDGRRFDHGHAVRAAPAARWEHRDWRSHEHRGWYAPPVYAAPPVVYAPPVAYAPPIGYAPAYYGGAYVDPDAATDAAFAAIVGGVMAAAIANSR